MTIASSASAEKTSYSEPLTLEGSGERGPVIRILIPAYRPTDRLIQLVKELVQHNVPIVVVDDGSGPDFSPVFAAIEKLPGVTLLKNAINLGKGAALKLGLNFLLVGASGPIGVVTADADGQHKVNDIFRVARQLAHSPDALVLGVRTFGAGTPARSLIGNLISKIVYRVVLGIKLSDTQTGLRGIPKRLAERSLTIRSNRYEFETEQLALVQQMHVRIAEVPIECVYEDNNASSHFDPFFDSFRIYFVVLRYAASSIVTSFVDLIAFSLIFSIAGNVLFSNLAARMIALGLQFQLLKSFVFHSTGGIAKLIAFIAYVLTMGLISGTLQGALASHFAVGILAAKISVETLIFTFNFLFLRDLLFKEPAK